MSWNSTFHSKTTIGATLRSNARASIAHARQSLVVARIRQARLTAKHMGAKFGRGKYGGSKRAARPTHLVGGTGWAPVAKKHGHGGAGQQARDWHGRFA